MTSPSQLPATGPDPEPRRYGVRIVEPVSNGAVVDPNFEASPAPLLNGPVYPYTVEDYAFSAPVSPIADYDLDDDDGEADRQPSRWLGAFIAASVLTAISGGLTVFFFALGLYSLTVFWAAVSVGGFLATIWAFLAGVFGDDRSEID